MNSGRFKRIFKKRQDLRGRRNSVRTSLMTKLTCNVKMSVKETGWVDGEREE